jgi:hypothetical protein
VRALHSPKRDHVAGARVTNDVGAFLRNQANGRAQAPMKARFPRPTASRPFYSNRTSHQVTSCCSAAKRRNRADGPPVTLCIRDLCVDCCPTSSQTRHRDESQSICRLALPGHRNQLAPVSGHVCGEDLYRRVSRRGTRLLHRRSRTRRSTGQRRLVPSRLTRPHGTERIKLVAPASTLMVKIIL